MDSQIRPLFNQAYSPDLYRRYQERLKEQLGPIPFRVAETPLFVTRELRERLVRQGLEITDQLAHPDLLARLKQAIPAKYDAPGMDVLPNCVQVDFGLVRAASGELEGKVVELQAFPSGYAMMSYFAEAWAELFNTVPALKGNWTCFVNGDAKSSYELMRRTICGDVEPQQVALVDFEPDKQKTVPDFVATLKRFGVPSVCATQLVKQGRRLFRRQGNQLVPVKRIYNRMVFDELEVKGYQLPFDWRDDLDLSWCSHPNWYWVWSKYSLPFLDHPAVPKARFLSELKEIPADLSGYVLKPLFSFAGSGVVIDVRREDVERVPAHQRDKWVLQEKVTYAPAIQAPGGIEVKAEIRVMLLRPPEAKRLEAVILLPRLSRGKMIGVDQNKGMDWQGGSVGMWRD